MENNGPGAPARHERGEISENGHIDNLQDVKTEYSEGNPKVPAVIRREVSNNESIANKSQIIEEKYSPTEFSALLEQELVIGHYFKSQLGERSSRSDQTRNLSRSDQTRSLSRSDQSGNMSRSDQSGNMSRSDQSGSMSRSDQSGSMSRDISSAPHHQERETGDDLHFSRWESEVCFVQRNSLQHRPRNTGNPEIVIVDYGQEEII